MFLSAILYCLFSPGIQLVQIPIMCKGTFMIADFFPETWYTLTKIFPNKCSWHYVSKLFVLRFV